MKVAAGLFGIFASVLAVVGLFCGGGVTCLGSMGLSTSETPGAVSPERYATGAGSQLGCLIFLIPGAALIALVGGIVSFAKPRLGGVIQLVGCAAILGAYGVSGWYAARAAGTEGATASIMAFVVGGAVPAVLSGLGALFGLLAGRRGVVPSS